MTNFFQIDEYSCSEASKFGLTYDGISYVVIDEDNDNSWLTTVINTEEAERRFIPINGCLSIDELCDDLAEICDGVFIFADNLAFTELKKNDIDFNTWIDEGAKNLKNTIKIFKNNQNIDNYQSRVAFLAYKDKRRVPEANTNVKNRFVNETGIQLYINHEILI